MGIADKLIDSARSTNEITAEIWLKPANTTQDGPARIVSLSKDPYNRNFTLGQGLWGGNPSDLYDARLRSTATNKNGTPSISSSAGSLTAELTHVVYTRDANGLCQIYIDGELAASGTTGGDLSNWDDFFLSLGNEVSGDRPWLGELHLVAFFDHALNADQVIHNFEAGY
jgi:hypothetical protein